MGGIDFPQLATDLMRLAAPVGTAAPIWLDGDAWDAEDRTGRLLRLRRRSDGAEVLVEIRVAPWVR
jgi:hypothetical protein